MDTNWEGVLYIALYVVVPWALCKLISRLADSNMNLLKHRFDDPQVGPVEGTGVEPPAVVLPRSPQSPAGTAGPRPGVPAGLQLPAGAAPPRTGTLPTAPAGSRRRVVLHG